MTDERLAGEITAVPKGTDAAALAKQYSGPAVSHAGTPQSAPAMLAGLPDVSAMTPAEAAAEHARCMKDADFMRNLSGSKLKMAHLEAISAARFGGGAGQKDAAAARATANSKAVSEATEAASAARREQLANEYAAATSDAERSRILAEMAKPVTLSVEETRAAEALAGRQAELADPVEQAYLDEASEPKSANEFHEFRGSTQVQGVLLENGVHAPTANYIAKQYADFSTWDDATYDGKVDAAAALVSKRADGRQILEDAKGFLRFLNANPGHPLEHVAHIASAFPNGIVELGRLGRRQLATN